MKTILLKHLKLTNYRNIDFAEYDFTGKQVQIIGDNRIGKTNTLESIYYLLTDSIFGNSNDIAQIKPLSDTKKVVDVEAVFEIIDGESTKEITLGKQYYENWVKTRGTSEMVMKGHSTDYFINKVKIGTMKEYNRLLADEFGFKQDELTKINFNKMLTDPYYLGEIGESGDWQVLRQFIIDLVGDVKDDDVFAREPSLLSIKDDLTNIGGKTDLLKKSYKQNIDSLNENIVGYKAQIELLEQTAKPTDEELAIAKKGISDIDDEISQVRNSKGVDFNSQEIQKQIDKLSIRISEVKVADANNESDEKRKMQSRLAEKQNELSSVIEERTSINDTLYNLNNKLTSLQYDYDYKTKHRLELIEKIKTIDTKLKGDLSKEVQTECPVCHRRFEEDSIQKHIEEYRSQLTTEKEKLIAEGVANKPVLEQLKSDIDNTTNLINSNKAKLEEKDTQRKQISEAINDIQTTIDDYDVQHLKVENKELTDLTHEKELLEQKLSESRKAFQNGQNTQNQAIYDLEQKRIPFEKVISDFNYYERQQANLNVVKDNLESDTTKLVAFEQKTELIKKFIYVKLNMLDENVAKVFGNIKFQLIRENINGGYDAICKPYIYDIENDKSTATTWKSGSKSEKVITGIAIADAVKNKLQLANLPFLFDEGGEISTNTFANKFKTESQIICVRVVDNIAQPMVKSI